MTGEMWNSNSVISWLLARSGLPANVLSPPAGGRAPGWEAGPVTAHREQPTDEKKGRRGARGVTARGTARQRQWPAGSSSCVRWPPVRQLRRLRRSCRAIRATPGRRAGRNMNIEIPPKPAAPATTFQEVPEAITAQASTDHVVPSSDTTLPDVTCIRSTMLSTRTLPTSAEPCRAACGLSRKNAEGSAPSEAGEASPKR
jgi:hypothetical protein